jgi:hypothetical protein
MNEMMKGLLDIDSAALQQYGHTIGLDLYQLKIKIACNFSEFVWVSFKKFVRFAIQRDTIEEVLLKTLYNLPPNFVKIFACYNYV